MALESIAEQYVTYDARVESFRAATTKRRASNATGKGKALKWPHAFLSAEELAKAGFFYYPSPHSPDNVACYLCHKMLDGWEEEDDPLVEHLKHSPDCGWAIVASIEAGDADLRVENPLSERLIEARTATFADRWPHEKKKGWKCKVKQLVDAGWKYTPTPENDDTTTCVYCELSLDGWEPADKPMDEHMNRSPTCPFFSLVNQYGAKKPKARKGRTSKASRASTQSTFTIAEDAPELDLEHDTASIVDPTETTIASQTGRKTKTKTTATKTRKTRTKKNEPAEAPATPPAEPSQPLEPEDDDFEVKVVATATKPKRGKKRTSEESVNTQTDPILPPAKRRASRAQTKDEEMLTEEMPEPTQLVVPKGPTGRKAALKKGTRTASRKTSRKVSTASTASRVTAPMEESIDEDKNMDDLTEAPQIENRETTMSDFDMFKPPIEVQDADVEAELEAIAKLEASNSESQSAPKKGRGKTRKTSTTEKAAPRKAAKSRAAESVEAVQPAQTSSDETATHYEAPGSKKVRTSTKSIKSIRSSILSATDSIATSTMDHGDSGNETDASQATVVKATRKRAGISKKAKTSKAATRHIEDVVQPSASGTLANPVSVEEAPPKGRVAKGKAKAVDESVLAEEPPAKASVKFSSPEVQRKSPNKKLTPSPSPQSSDAENQPPSSRPATITRSPVRVPLAAVTPTGSPSKRNVIGGLQSSHPWTEIDADVLFLHSPGENENMVGNLKDAFELAQKGELSSPEKKMTVEQWIVYNADVAEGRLKSECERMVGMFESQGGRAMQALEGLECSD